MARIILMVLGVCFCLSGAVFVLQGTGLVPHDSFLGRSFMVGDAKWAWIGLLSLVVGAAMLYFGATMPKKQPKG